MKRSTAPQLALAGGLAAAFTALAMTIAPGSHDYGQVAVNALGSRAFHVTLPLGTPTGTTLTVTLAGPDSRDFVSASSAISVFHPFTGCAVGAQAITCTETVDFRPKSLGPKVATLIVADNRGTTVTAALKGVGVAPLCRYVVVPCNYSHHFTGVFGWRSVLTGPSGTETESVDLSIKNGVAICSGGATSRGSGRSVTGSINGPGLIGVEFEPDPVYTWVYRITVACPTPAWPATADSEATPSQPAEMGQNEQSSEKQPAGGVGLTLQEAIARLARLQGSITYPSPDTDAANGVTGSVTVSWNLVRS